MYVSTESREFFVVSRKCMTQKAESNTDAHMGFAASNILVSHILGADSNDFDNEMLPNT